VAYGSTQTHSHLENDIRVAGIGSDNLRSVGVDGPTPCAPTCWKIHTGRPGRGRKPFLVVPPSHHLVQRFRSVPPIGEICQRNGLWMHVDGAMCARRGGSGIPWVNRASSRRQLVFNPHKWMFTGFDGSALREPSVPRSSTRIRSCPSTCVTRPRPQGRWNDYRDRQCRWADASAPSSSGA
jgi:aromatic-L-amino-acid decarboxylase